MTHLSLTDLREANARALASVEAAQDNVVRAAAKHARTLSDAVTTGDLAAVEKAHAGLEAAKRALDLATSVLETVATKTRQAEEAAREEARDAIRAEIRDHTEKLRALAVAVTSQHAGLISALQEAAATELAARKLAGSLEPVKAFFPHVGADFARSLANVADLDDAAKMISDRFKRATDSVEAP